MYSSGLRPKAPRVADAVHADGGALAAADLGELSRTVAPFAREALETGLDLGIHVRAGASLVTAVIATLGLRPCRQRRCGGRHRRLRPLLNA